MFANRYTQLFLVVAAAALLALPATAMAGPGLPDDPAVKGEDTSVEVSPVDEIASDIAKDGIVNTTDDSTMSDASDSPTVETYGRGDDPLPPPIDCDGAVDGGGPADDDVVCDEIVECSADDLDGLDANGEPCDANVPSCEDAGTCGGGTPPTEVSGGGGNPPVTLNAVPTVTGGGDAALPFTGMPIAWVFAAGAMFMLAGGALWLRGRFGANEA